MTLFTTPSCCRPKSLLWFFNRRILWPFCWVLYLLVLTLPASANTGTCLLQPLSPTLKFSQASLVIEGKVLSQTSFWDAARQNIYTSSQVSVYKVFKGTALPETVEVITEGGTVGPDRHVFSATLNLLPGQVGVFYLQPAPAGAGSKHTFSVFGSLQGFILYQLSAQTASAPFDSYTSVSELYRQLQHNAQAPFRTVKPGPELSTKTAPPNVFRQQALPVILSFSPERITAGTGSQLTIKGLNFGNNRGNGFVEFRNANDGGTTFIKPLAADYISWTDTEIVVRVPSAGTDEAPAGTGTFRVTNNDPAPAISPKPLLVEFVYTNVKVTDVAYSPDHINNNTLGGYTFRFSNGFNGNSAAKEAFIRSVNNWTCNTTINWQATGTTPATTAVSDNINIVCFDGAKQLPAGVLGRCISRYKGCSAGGTVVYFVNELDLEFDDATRWQFGPAAPAANQFDFETVALHELGHGHQLGHIISPGAVMHYAIGPGRQNRSLNPINDIAGGAFVADRSFTSNACGPGPMTPRAGTDCPLPQELVSFEAVFVPDSGVVLNWATYQERNITSFKVERSPDASNWTEIATVPALGTTTGTTFYHTTDTEPLAVITYYRLRIQKGDGSFLFSQIVEVITQEVQFNTLEVIENPVKDILRVRYSTDDLATLNLTIYDETGRLHKRFLLELGPGANVTTLPIEGLGLGMYLLHWTDQKQSKTVRIAKITN